MDTRRIYSWILRVTTFVPNESAAFNQHGVGYKREQIEYNMNMTFQLM